MMPQTAFRAVCTAPSTQAGGQLMLSGWGRQLVHKGHVKRVVLTVSAASAAILLWRALI